jgi:hypothetical protein
MKVQKNDHDHDLLQIVVERVLRQRYDDDEGGDGLWSLLEDVGYNHCLESLPIVLRPSLQNTREALVRSRSYRSGN